MQFVFLCLVEVPLCKIERHCPPSLYWVVIFIHSIYITILTVVAVFVDLIVMNGSEKSSSPNARYISVRLNLRGSIVPQ